MQQLRIVLFVSALVLPSIAGAQERVLRAELDLPAPPATVWNLWTTVEGLQSFLAPAARIEPVVDGEFEILFSPDAPEGQRGAEGLRVVAFEPQWRFAFTWNAPNDLPSIRAQRTIVEIRLIPTASGTHLTFLHWGWGLGPEWEKAYDYFDKAWGGFVLPSLVNRITAGPMNWKAAPSLKPLPGSMKSLLTLSPRQ